MDQCLFVVFVLPFYCVVPAPCALQRGQTFQVVEAFDLDKTRKR